MRWSRVGGVGARSGERESGGARSERAIVLAELLPRQKRWQLVAGEAYQLQPGLGVRMGDGQEAESGSGQSAPGRSPTTPINSSLVQPITIRPSHVSIRIH